MRKMKILVSIVAMMCLIFSLSACAGGKTNDEPEGQLDGIEIRDGDGETGDVMPEVKPDPGISDDDEGEPDGTDDTGDEGEISPGTHDGYYHEVDGVSFYTEHDINQWLSPNERHPEVLNFDIGQMICDIWGENGGSVLENDVGFSYLNGEDWAKGIWFEVPDADAPLAFHMVTVFYSHDGVEYTTSIRIYNYPMPLIDHKSEYYAVLDQYYHYIDSDMAPLILLAVERMEANPQNSVLNDLPLGDNFYCN